MSSLSSSGSRPRTQPQPDGEGGGGDSTDAAAGPSAQTPTAPASTSPVKTPTTPASTSPVKTTTAPASSSTSSTSPAKPAETTTDLSSLYSDRQKETVTQAITMLLSAGATPSSSAANNKGAALGPPSSPSSSAAKQAQRTQTGAGLTSPQVSTPAAKKANNRPLEGQKVSKIPVTWSPEKVKGAALGLLAKRWSSAPPGQTQTPDRTGQSTGLSSSPQKENISEDAPPSRIKEEICEDGAPPPPVKRSKLCSDAAVAALSAAMGLLAKNPPPAPPLLAKSPPTATPTGSTPSAKKQVARLSYAKQLKALSDGSPAIMRRYKPRPPGSATPAASSAAARRNKVVVEAQPSLAIMRRKTFRSKARAEGSSAAPTTATSGQKAANRRGDARQKANMARLAPKVTSPPNFKVTGAVFCEGRVMGLLATRPISGASAASSVAVKQHAESSLPAQKAVKRPADGGGPPTAAKIPVAWSPEKVKGATMGLLAKASDPPSSTQSIQQAEEGQTCSSSPVTWSPEKVKGVLSLVAKRSAPSPSSDVAETETEDSMAVLRLRQRIIRPQRKVVKKGPLQKIAHYVKLGHLNKLPAEIMALPGLYDQVVSEVMKRVKEECARVTRSAFGSVLRRTSLQALKDFRWEELVEEWRRSAPTFLKFLQSAAAVSLDGRRTGGSSKEADTAEARTKKRVAAMAGAMALHARSRHMRAPMVRNSLLLHAGDKKRCFQRFRTQGLCVSYKQTLAKVKEMGDNQEVLLWGEDAIAPAGGGGGGAGAVPPSSQPEEEEEQQQQQQQLQLDGGGGGNNIAVQPDIDVGVTTTTITITTM